MECWNSQLFESEKAILSPTSTPSLQYSITPTVSSRTKKNIKLHL